MIKRRFLISANRILHVIEGDVEHESNQQDGAGALQHFKHPNIERPPADCLQDCQEDMPTVEHGNR